MRETALAPNPHHRRRALALVAALLLPLFVIGVGGVLASALFTNARAAYLSGVVRTGKEPAFLLTLSFLLTFGVVRLVTYAIRDHALPFLHNVTTKSGLHIHHMVPGMLLALSSGYFALVLTADRPTRLLAVGFGIGTALVLDEFALWLRLADVYWAPAGRESIDAVVLAGGIGVLGVLGLGFWPRLFAATLEVLKAVR